MNVLITGAQFSNKGAQALLFTTVNELRIRYDNVNIYYVPIDWRYNKTCFDNTHDYRFIFVFDDQYIYDEPLHKGVLSLVKRKYSLIKKRTKLNNKEVRMLSKIWDEMDVLIDVSGYQLSSKFKDSSVSRNMRYFRTASQKGIPVILMPQSFGPFDYKEKTNEMTKKLSESLSEVNLIFAREEEGRQALKSILKDKEIILSPDLVLQSKDVEWRNIYVQRPSLSYRIIKTDNNVCIIPNSQTIRLGNEKEIMEMYKAIIDELLRLGKNVYIFKHSYDLKLCRKIYSLFEGKQGCYLIEDDMSYLEYEEFVRQFDYIIASRYHAIVCAYKKGIPSLVLGWSVKYPELARHVRQEKYVFDISDSIDIEKIVSHLKLLDDNHEYDKQIINSCVETVQKENCFNRCWGIMDNL